MPNSNEETIVLQNESPTNNKVAGFGIRLLAFIIDLVIVFVGLLIVRFLLFVLDFFMIDFLSKNILFHYSLTDIILYLCKVTYFIVFTYCLKATPGKKICRLQVVSAIDEPVTFFNILYRETIGRYLSGLVLGIGYLLIFINPDKQALHDMLSDTKVVHTT